MFNKILRNVEILGLNCRFQLSPKISTSHKIWLMFNKILRNVEILGLNWNLQSSSKIDRFQWFDDFEFDNLFEHKALFPDSFFVGVTIFKPFYPV